MNGKFNNAIGTLELFEDLVREADGNQRGPWKRPLKAHDKVLQRLEED